MDQHAADLPKLLVVPRRLACVDDPTPIADPKNTIIYSSRKMIALRCGRIVAWANRDRRFDVRFRWPQTNEPLVASYSFRNFAALLAGQVPSLFDLFSLRGTALAALTFARLPNLRVLARAGEPTCQLAFSLADFRTLFAAEAALMKAEMERRGECSDRYDARCVELRRYFGLAGEESL